MKFIITFLISIPLALCAHLPKKYVLDSYLESPVVKNFVEYVKIDTSKEENLHLALNFWQRKALELDLDYKIYYPANLPVCVLSWYGSNPGLPSIMLNSHMDVVPVEEAGWTYPPFAAQMDENGNIYGRGTQDDKDVAIMYLEAIRKLKEDGIRLNRTLHITLMPDEETGSERGMVKFLEAKEFKDLNVGFALDEGIASADDKLYVTYLDKRPWQMKITVRGESGHGSSVSEVTAMDKFRNLVNIISDYREQQKAVMKAGNTNDFGAYDSLNINLVHGGMVPNVIPGEINLVVDMRLAVSANVTDVSDRVSSWLQEAGNDTSILFIRKILVSEATKVDDSNPYWVAMRDAIQELDMEIIPIVCPAVSDKVYLRNRGIPALGFAFKPRTISRIHGNNEYMNVENLIQGVNVYVRILSRLGRMGDVVYVP